MSHKSFCIFLSCFFIINVHANNENERTSDPAKILERPLKKIAEDLNKPKEKHPTEGLHPVSEHPVSEHPVSEISPEKWGGHQTIDLLANHTTKSGRTPLHYVAVWREPKDLKALLEAGAKVNAEDKFGKTPADHAQRAERPENLELLIANGGKLTDTNCWTIFGSIK